MTFSGGRTLKGTFFFSSKGGRFLFLKKRNKRHCGIVDLSEKRCFPARPARNEKTDGSHTNRPFCGAGWRKQQKRRNKRCRKRFSFAWSVCTGKLARRRGGHGQRQGGGGRHTRCGIPTDDNAGCACVRPSEGLRFPRIPTVFSSKKKRRPLVASNAAFHYTIFISTNHGDAHACQCRCAGSRASPDICFIR